MIKRALQGKNSAAHSISAMISRCYRQSVQPSEEALTHSEHHKSWITSYIEQLDRSQLYLRPSSAIIHPMSINRLAKPEFRDIVDWISAQTEVETIRDLLYIPDPMEPQFLQYLYNHPLVPYLRLPETAVSDSNTLMIGRRYLSSTGAIYEFRGQLLPA